MLLIRTFSLSHFSFFATRTNSGRKGRGMKQLCRNLRLTVEKKEREKEKSMCNKKGHEKKNMGKTSSLREWRVERPYVDEGENFTHPLHFFYLVVHLICVERCSECNLKSECKYACWHIITPEQWKMRSEKKTR